MSFWGIFQRQKNRHSRKPTPKHQSFAPEAKAKRRYEADDDGVDSALMFSTMSSGVGTTPTVTDSSPSCNVSDVGAGACDGGGSA